LTGLTTIAGIHSMRWMDLFNAPYIFIYGFASLWWIFAQI
jgi:hypothetical protein